jgi:hypothetical protein
MPLPGVDVVTVLLYWEVEAPCPGEDAVKERSPKGEV